MKPFANEPRMELRRHAARDRLLVALERLDRSLPLEVGVEVADEARFAHDFESLDPANTSCVARCTEAVAGDVEAAIAAAGDGAREWGSRSAAERAGTLCAAAATFRETRPSLTALVVREAGKPWVDADAEVCEAIDFLEYYARAAVALEAGPRLLQPPGERNVWRYVPRGVAAVIAPWNFPVAISTGMVAAGLAAGNAVLYKPATETPACGSAVVDALRGAGVPAGALALLPGGDRAGAALVAHPGVHTIAFTGSCQVGLEISRVAATPAPGQSHLKRVIAEMGGKNCVLVDSDADLDAVVPAVADSAFAFAGQKCSAASRVLVHEAVAEHLAERLAGATRALEVGLPERFGVDLGPVIDQDAVERFRRYTEIAATDGEILAGGAEVPAGGFYCPPTLVAGLSADSPLVAEEVFAPLLTLEVVPTLTRACELVEASRFGLTAGLFTRNPAVVAELERRLPVGNLYVNRGITGAVVGRQPFGGNRLSGTGAKAGGPDYLLPFVEARVVSENLMRHGLPV